MAISNKDRISRTLDLLRDGLVPFVERELKAKLGSGWQKSVNDSLRKICASARTAASPGVPRVCSHDGQVVGRR